MLANDNEKIKSKVMPITISLVSPILPTSNIGNLMLDDELLISNECNLSSGAGLNRGEDVSCPNTEI